MTPYACQSSVPQYHQIHSRYQKNTRSSCEATSNVRFSPKRTWVTCFWFTQSELTGVKSLSEVASWTCWRLAMTAWARPKQNTITATGITKQACGQNAWRPETLSKETDDDSVATQWFWFERSGTKRNDTGGRFVSWELRDYWRAFVEFCGLYHDRLPSFLEPEMRED